jgi:AcrR family transcriptional regulator
MRALGLTRDRVLQAAVALADAEGIAAVPMRRLGQELGVEAMSLYKHVTSKDDILGGIVEIAAGEIELPRVGGDWRTAMHRRATSAHVVLMRHPWATMLIVSRANTGPVMLRYVDATIGCLRHAGFSYPMADHAWNAIDSHIYGFTLQKLNFPFEPDQYAAMPKKFIHLIPADEFPHLNGMSQDDLGPSGLARVVGLARRAHRRQRAPARGAVGRHPDDDGLAGDVVAYDGAVTVWGLDVFADGGGLLGEVLIQRMFVLQAAHQPSTGAGDAQRVHGQVLVLRHPYRHRFEVDQECRAAELPPA